MEHSNRTTRRTVVKTGAKLAYAAPLVAATMTLSASGAAAVSPTCTADSGQDCGTYVPCGVTSLGNPCVCARAGDRTVCSAYGACDRPCDTDADCAIVTGAYGDTAPGYCHTTTCCDTQGKRGACAPLCQ